MTTIDYYDLDEDQCRKKAKKKLPGEDEKYANEMVTLIKEAKAGTNIKESEPYKKCRVIGNYLCGNGGHWRMVLVARRVEVLSNDMRYCEWFWEDICGWMS